MLSALSSLLMCTRENLQIQYPMQLFGKTEENASSHGPGVTFIHKCNFQGARFPQRRNYACCSAQSWCTTFLSGHGCSRQHKPDSSLSPWALPGASEQKVIRAGWECPLWKHMERETLKHFPSFRKNWKWKRHPTQAQGRHIHRSCISPLKSNLFNIPIKQIMHCWHGGKEYGLTVLIVQAMWIKFSIIYISVWLVYARKWDTTKVITIC